MALLLRDVVGLSYTEIADSLEVTLATVKWRIYKAREDVQLALAREGIYLYGADLAAPAAPAVAAAVELPGLLAERERARRARPAGRPRASRPASPSMS